jgi:acylphosphatase
MERIEAVVHGKVQGVYFRNFVVDTALALGVVGQTKNLSDGTVHVLAEGEKERLLLLIERLHEGPELAEVSAVEVNWHDASGEHDTFIIAH